MWFKECQDGGEAGNRACGRRGFGRRCCGVVGHWDGGAVEKCGGGVTKIWGNRDSATFERPSEKKGGNKKASSWGGGVGRSGFREGWRAKKKTDGTASAEKENLKQFQGTAAKTGGKKKKERL